ncbi:MAG: oligoendopeptidase F [Bacteroidia bacterium]|nr:MAG: oligoendopeptidase F [Bacteroidia bacterium]
MITSSVKQKRNYISPNFEIQDWSSLEPYYEGLKNFPIHSKEQLEEFLLRCNELSSVISETFAWIYISMTCNTNDTVIAEKYQYFVTEILPKIGPNENELQKKYYYSPYRSLLDKDKFLTFDRSIANEIEIYRSENEELQGKARVKSQEYDNLVANLSVIHNGETLTMQKAASLLELPNRKERESIWRKMQDARLSVENKIDLIFEELIQLRHQMALNAGFSSFTEYMFRKLGRFDYSPRDCEKFHEGIEKVIKPIYIKIMEDRKRKLGVECLRPWDTVVDPHNLPPLRPFQNGKELLEKTILMYQRIRPELADMIITMKEMGHFDLESREGKAPGGYNYPLAETGIPFIFMNAVGTQSDLTTMVHECGHAFHSFLTKDYELNAFKETPSEIAELASMSMEFLSMKFWDTFYHDPKDLQRSQYEQIVRSILILPWVASVDLFQTWIYNHPKASFQERKNQWIPIYERFHGNVVDWSGLEKEQSILWQKQGHIFDVPFYYIEYGMAQIGALQVWKNSIDNFDKALEDYLSALKLGYTRPIPQIYQAANVVFDFSPERLQELSQLVLKKLEELEY